MTAPIVVEDKRLIITSHSLDNLFDYCNRKFEFVTMWDDRIDKESGYAADVGTAIHRGVQAWLIAKHEGHSEDTARIMGAMAFLRSFPWEMEENQRSKIRSFENSAWCLEGIWNHTFWDDWELIKIDRDGVQRWAVEVPWLIIHRGIGATDDGRFLATQGTIDLIMRNRSSGEVVPIDIKTTTYDEGKSRALYLYSGQQIGYSMVVEALLGNHIKALSYRYFVARINPEGPKYEILVYDKDTEALEDYWISKLDRLNAIKLSANRQHFNRTNGGCFIFNTECAFFDICARRDKEYLDDWFRDSANTVPKDMPDWWVRLEI